MQTRSGLQEDAMDREGGQGAVAGSAGARGRPSTGAVAGATPATVVPAPGAGAGQLPLDVRGGGAHRGATARARQQVGHYRALPPWSVQQRREVPRELRAPQDAAGLPRQGHGGRRRHRRIAEDRGKSLSVPTECWGDGMDWYVRRRWGRRAKLGSPELIDAELALSLGPVQPSSNHREACFWLCL